MTVTVSRKRRGSETQAAAAAWFATHGWPYAESTGAGRPGSDITGIPGLACEVKARRELRLIPWLRQAARTAGLPFVICRPDGMGPAVVADWPVMIRLEDFTGLLLAAGYGTEENVMTSPTVPPQATAAEDRPPLNAIGEFRNAVWRIVTYAADEGTCGYLLSEDQVDEIADEAHEYAKGLAAAERERCAQLAHKHMAWCPGKPLGPGLAEPGRFFSDVLREAQP